MTNLEFNKRADALRESSETKENFVCDKITENDLYDFIFYKVYNGDEDKMNEDIADYFSDDYARYCDDIIAGWNDDDDDDDFELQVLDYWTREGWIDNDF